MDDLTLMIESCLAEAETKAGRPIEWLMARGLSVDGLMTRVQGKRSAGRARWTDDEIEKLSAWMGVITMDEIAKRLGRSYNAVLIKAKKMQLARPTRHPDYLTACQACHILGIDTHIMPGWIRAGIIEGEAAPTSGRQVSRIRWVTFKRWLVKPTSWCYFDVERIKIPSIRRLVKLAQKRWGDEWWDTRQAADYLGCDVKDVLRAIKQGRVPGAFRASSKGGRDLNGRWAWWYIPKSQVMKLRIYTYDNYWRYEWGERADAFILRARADGKKWGEIARMMKKNQKAVKHYGRRLMRKNA